MGVITTNPSVSLQANIGAPVLYYLSDGAAIFGCIGSPEGVIAANKRSLALSDNGNVYYKTTDSVNTGWSALGGGGGGTVTTFSAGGLSPLFTSSVATATTTPALSFAQISQSANLVYASPNGSAGVPTFRALTSSDLAASAAPPAGGIQYNDGTNGFTASNGLKFDSASNTTQIGESTVLKGTLQLFAALGTGSIKHTVNNPGGNFVFIWPDSLPTNNDLARFSVSGSNVTIDSVAASGLGFPTINATDGTIPYRSSSSAFSDSPLARVSATETSYNTKIRPVSAINNAAMLAVNTAGNTGIGLGSVGAGGIAFVHSGTVQGDLSSDGFRVRSDLQMGWFSGVFGTSMDTGIARLGAGVSRVTNGSTGAGQFAVGSSTASTANQFLVDSQSTTRIAGYFSMPNGSSVATIQGVTNSIQSFAFMPSGKIIGGMNIPTTNQQTAMIGNAKSDVSTIGNVGTGVDNLLSFVIQANVLANTGDYAEFDAFGEFAANANNKTLKIVYGTTTIFNTGAVAFNASNWRIHAKILYTGASAQKTIVTFWSNDATTPFLQEIFATTESNAANKTVQFTGEATSNDDITQLHLESRLVIALTS